MFSKLFGKSKNSKKAAPSESKIGEIRPERLKHLLVIDGDRGKDWRAIFAGATVRVRRQNAPPRPPSEGSASTSSAAASATAASSANSTEGASAAAEYEHVRVKVHQAGWKDLLVCGYADRVVVDFRCQDADGNRMPSVTPDFVLVRNECRGVGSGMDWRRALYGLIYGNVPSLNSLSSIVMFNERPLVHAELLAIQKRIGRENFPVIKQNYYPSHRAMLIGPEFPAVVKVGHAHAGYGKMIVNDHHAFADFASVMAVADNYCTAETFESGVFNYDLRIQKIGPHIRAFKRVSMSGNWKTNTGTSVIEEVPVTAEFRRWAVEASRMFGGLDICTVDAIHVVPEEEGRRLMEEAGAAHTASVSVAAPSTAASTASSIMAQISCKAHEDIGYNVILEVNGTSSGFAPDCEAEDNIHVRDLVLQKMTAA